MLLRCVRWILDYKIDYAEVKNIEKERKVLGFRFYYGVVTTKAVLLLKWLNERTI